MLFHWIRKIPRHQLGTVVQTWKIFKGWRPSQLCPIVMTKPEFTVSRLERRKSELLCLLIDGLEAMPACNFHPACPAFIVPEQEISPEPVICWGSRGKRVYLFHCQAVCVLEAFLLVLSVKMYIHLVILQQRPHTRACWWTTKRLSYCFNTVLLEVSKML